MSKIVTIGDCTLYLGDCREIVGGLSGVDAVVTDPPYGVRHRRGDSRICETIVGDLEPPDVRWIAKYPAIVWGGNNFCDQLPRSTGWLVWDKHEPTTSRHSHCELAWTNTVRAMRVHRQAFRGFMATAAHDSDRVHSNQKPIKLMRWCLSFMPSGIIADPFMGSGSTGVAAVMEGRKFIGIEIDPTHFETACRRIRRAVQDQRSQLPLEVA